MLWREGSPSDGATVCARRERICSASPSPTSTAPSGPASKPVLEGLASASPATGALVVGLLDIRLAAASGWSGETGPRSEQAPRVRRQAERKESTGFMEVSFMYGGAISVEILRILKKR